MKVPAFLRGPYVVARQEFLVNLKSVRLLIMLVVLALVVVGGAYGLSAGSGGGGPTLTPVVIWGHLALGPVGERLAVVWVSDPFGEPFRDVTVFFLARENEGEIQLGQAQTDTNGLARLAIGDREVIEAHVRLGTGDFGYGFRLFTPEVNFTVAYRLENLDNDRLHNDLGIHVLTLTGVPAAANISLNDTFVTSTDVLGFAEVELPPGSSNLTVEMAGERERPPWPRRLPNRIRPLSPPGRTLFSS